MPRFVNYLADYSGCGHWRLIWPENVINMTQRGISQSTTAMVADPRWYQGVKAVTLQRQASKSQVEFTKHLKKIQQEHGFKIIYEVDDVIFREEIPDYNKFKFAFDTKEVRDNCVEIMDMADELTLTCDFMRNLFQSKLTNQNVTVIPNFVPYNWMGYLYACPEERRDRYVDHDQRRGQEADLAAEQSEPTVDIGREDRQEIIDNAGVVHGLLFSVRKKWRRFASQAASHSGSASVAVRQRRRVSP